MAEPNATETALSPSQQLMQQTSLDLLAAVYWHTLEAHQADNYITFAVECPGKPDGPLSITIGRSAGAKTPSQRIEELEAAIRQHRDQKGDDRCFLDDRDLYAVLGDGVQAETQLPPASVFLESCMRFWRQRQQSGQHQSKLAPGCLTLGQLENLVITLREAVAWYADPANYKTSGVDGFPLPSAIAKDQGRRARQALSREESA